MKIMKIVLPSSHRNVHYFFSRKEIRGLRKRLKALKEKMDAMESHFWRSLTF